MTKTAWIEHMKEVSGKDNPTMHDVVTHHADVPDCQACKDRKRTRNANKRQKAIRDVYASCGMVRVRGSLGGTYYE